MERRRHLRAPERVLWQRLVLLLLMLNVRNSVQAVKPKFDDEDFLYHTPEAKGIIHDYEPQEGVTEPDFLYGPNQGPRIVEFYAPWCPHCQHFRQHYIGFARQVNDILDEYYSPTLLAAPPTNSSNQRKSWLRSFPTTVNTTVTTSPPYPNVPRVTFYAISCTVNQKVCHKQGVHAFPKIKLFRANTTGNATADIVYFKLHAFDVLSQLQIAVDGGSDAMFQNKAERSTTASDSAVKDGPTTMEMKHSRRTKQQVFDDAHLSFLFTLRSSVFTDDQPLQNSTKMALFSWLKLVQTTTPVVWSLRRVITALLDDFDAVTRNEEALFAVLDAHPPPTAKWSLSCTKGVPGMGYTCGLWQLLHIISVGLVEYNLVIPASDDEVLTTMSLSTPAAAETIRSFIEHFMGCDECRRHFLHAYDACALDRCNRLSAKAMDYKQWIQFPVWLYETHNAVNARLLRERVAREHLGAVSLADQVSSQWPRHRACPKCWLEHGAWHEENIYKYLRAEYWYETHGERLDYFVCSMHMSHSRANCVPKGRKIRYRSNIETTWEQGLE